MDNAWERSIPFVPLGSGQALQVLKTHWPGVRIDRLVPLTEGKRSTNYCVFTSEGRLLLRLHAEEDDSWLKQQRAREALGATVPMQQLLFSGRHAAIGNRTYAVYDYVEGTSLLQAMRDGLKPDLALMRQLAEALAAIHTVRYEAVGFLDVRLKLAEPLPPLREWYGLFLTADARRRLGERLAERIERVVHKRLTVLEELDAGSTLVHGDFRPTNLLVRDGRLVCVLDWEFMMAGHSMSDVGQLFRYEEQFAREQKAAFAEAYNRLASRPLPDGWELYGKLRDLVNLLQMLGEPRELPNKFADLTRLAAASVLAMEE